MNLSLSFVLLLVNGIGLLVNAQSIEFKKYTYNQNDAYTRLNFSFEIPDSWVISREPDGTGFFLNCKPASALEIEKYNFCNDSIIFKAKYYRGNLDSVLTSKGFEKGIESAILKGDKSVKIFPGKESALGIHFTQTGVAPCEGEATKAIVQHICFSDSKQTICLLTNGVPLDGDVLDRITTSFRFD